MEDRTIHTLTGRDVRVARPPNPSDPGVILEMISPGYECADAVVMLDAEAAEHLSSALREAVDYSTRHRRRMPGVAFQR